MKIKIISYFIRKLFLDINGVSQYYEGEMYRAVPVFLYPPVSTPAQIARVDLGEETLKSPSQFLLPFLHHGIKISFPL